MMKRNGIRKECISLLFAGPPKTSKYDTDAIAVTTQIRAAENYTKSRYRRAPTALEISIYGSPLHRRKVSPHLAEGLAFLISKGAVEKIELNVTRDIQGTLQGEEAYQGMITVYHLTPEGVNIAYPANNLSFGILPLPRKRGNGENIRCRDTRRYIDGEISRRASERFMEKNKK